jgi:hypothetical protein
MFGVNVESIDFNLPVDALTEKPLFAFSCNRHVRENYRGPLLLADDNSPISVDNLSTKVGSKVKGIFDQKARYGHGQHDATAEGNIIFKTQSSYYYLEFDGSSYFTLPIDQYLVGDIGVLVVCDPDGGGRAPVFSGVSPTHELSFDVGTAYMRFAYYQLADKQKLFGGIDSPEVGLDGYVGNFADEIRIDNVSGSTGKAVRGDNIGNALTSCMIGRDSTHYFTGKLYEMVVTDFEIQPDSISQVFDDWRNYYSLT